MLKLPLLLLIPSTSLPQKNSLPSQKYHLPVTHLPSKQEIAATLILGNQASSRKKTFCTILISKGIEKQPVFFLLGSSTSNKKKIIWRNLPNPLLHPLWQVSQPIPWEDHHFLAGDCLRLPHCHSLFPSSILLPTNNLPITYRKTTTKTHISTNARLATDMEIEDSLSLYAWQWR